MRNTSSSYTSIFEVEGLKDTQQAKFLKKVSDLLLPKEVFWLYFRRFHGVPELIKSEENNQKKITEAKEFSKEDVIEYFKDNLGLAEIAEFVNKNYQPVKFNNVNWTNTEITEEEIMRLQGIDPTKAG